MPPAGPRAGPMPGDGLSDSCSPVPPAGQPSRGGGWTEGEYVWVESGYPGFGQWVRAGAPPGGAQHGQPDWYGETWRQHH